MDKKIQFTVLLSSAVAKLLKDMKDKNEIKSYSKAIRTIVEKHFKGKIPLLNGQKSIFDKYD